MKTKLTKIYKTIKENYIYINITFLVLAIYVIFFPIISSQIQKIIPQFGICPYLRLTGNPCPLCGGTRYIKDLPHVFEDITYLFHPFGIMVMAIFIEIIWRILYIIFRRKLNEEKLKRIIEFDIIFHAIEAIVFIMYEILFLL